MPGVTITIRRARRAAQGAAAAGLVAAIATLSAQQPQQQPAGSTQKPTEAPAAKAPQAPPPKPLVPLVASTLAAKPDQFMGENVTVMATVDQILSPLAFSIDQDRTKSEGKDVLVFAPRLNEPVSLNTYVTVIGEVIKFDPADAKLKDRLSGFPADAASKFAGRPTIVATSVINDAMNDLARRLPPKMTPEEEAFQKVMQKVNAANGAFRGIIEKSDVNGAKEQAAALKAAFASTEAFFRPHRKADAIGWAQEARKFAEAIEVSAAAGKWDEVKTTTGSLGKMCQACHTAYRERYDDGSFRVKLGG